MQSVDSIVTRLLALHPKLIDLSLDRMWRLLAALGHPERKLPPVIHVAGTNGKGSTIAFMRAILEAAGLRVHVYTSPHLVRFNERFRLGRVGRGRAGVGRGACRRVRGMRARQCRRADHGVRDHHGGGAVAVLAPSGRRAAARSRARRPARRHQCGRAAARDRRHAGLVRSCRLSRRQHREDRRPRRPASSSATCRRSSPRSRARRWR